MAKQKMTHIGVLRGVDARVQEGFKRRISLRETKCYWISKYGIKYSKKWNGSGTGDWPMYRLQIDSIIPIEDES